MSDELRTVSDPSTDKKEEKREFVVKVLFNVNSIDKTVISREYEQAVQATILFPWNDVKVSCIRQLDPQGPIIVFVDVPFILEEHADGTCRIKAWKGQKT